MVVNLSQKCWKHVAASLQCRVTVIHPLSGDSRLYSESRGYFAFFGETLWLISKSLLRLVYAHFVWLMIAVFFDLRMRSFEMFPLSKPSCRNESLSQLIVKVGQSRQEQWFFVPMPILTHGLSFTSVKMLQLWGRSSLRPRRFHSKFWNSLRST